MLRYPTELRNISSVPSVGIDKIDEAQLKLANVLVIETMSKAFDQFRIKDRYFNSLMEIIQAKIAGKKSFL